MQGAVLPLPVPSSRLRKKSLLAPAGKEEVLARHVRIRKKSSPVPAHVEDRGAQSMSLDEARVHIAGEDPARLRDWMRQGWQC